MTASTPISPFSFRRWQASQLRHEQRREAVSWGLSLLAVMAVGAGCVALLVQLPKPPQPVPEAPPAAIAIDLAPEAVATPSPPDDSAPGPQQTLSQPDPDPELPPEVAAPLAPAPNPPVPVPAPEKIQKIIKKRKPLPSVKTPVPDKTHQADQTTAPPSVQAPPAPAQAAPAPGASTTHAAHDPVTWQGLLLGRLERFKRYPAQAQAEQRQGTAFLTFSMDRKGHVLSARLARSSGHIMLDQETLALVRRAEPLPVPPDSVAGDPVTLTVPVEFYIRQNSE